MKDPLLEEIKRAATPVESQTASFAQFAERPNRQAALAVVDGRTNAASSSIIKDDMIKVKNAIAAERSAKGKPSFATNEKVVELLIDAFNKRGEFFHDGVRGYAFLRDGRVLLPLDFGEQGLELALCKYGLFPNENITKQVIHGLRLEALGNGRRTDVHAFSYYERRSHTVYVYDFEGGIYRITPGSVEHVDNGTDGILFIQNPQWTPWKLATVGSSSLEWHSWLLYGIRFVPGALNEEDQRLLFRIWVLALFFPQLFPTRPILTLIGEKGSGKSSLLRRLGQLLFGPKFNVAALTSKPDDFDAAITTDAFVVADNADDAPKWFPDKLAVGATGGTIKRRAYYSTNNLADFPIRATLAITSRTPNFQREDVAERLLPLCLGRIEEFGPESALLAEVQEQREALLGSITGDVALALGKLKAYSGKTFTSQFRMADFADFAMKIAPVVGKTSDEIRALLDRLSGQQVAFASDDEPLLPLLDAWLADESQHVNIDRDIALPDLGREIEGMEGRPGPVPWEAGNPRSFGQYVRNRKGTLERLYGMTERVGHGGAAIVSFHHLQNGDLGDLGDDKSHALAPSLKDNERTES